MAEAEIEPLELDAKFVRYLRTGTQGTFFLPGINKAFRLHSNAFTEMINDSRGIQAIDTIKRISTEKLYFKREPLLFYLACATHSSNMDIKKAAYAILNDVCETPADLFLFLKHAKILGQLTKGWGRALRRAVSSWYNTKDPITLAEMVTRYKCGGQTSHGGKWSHKDILRLGHIIPANDNISFIMKVITKGIAEAKKSVPEPSDDIQKLVTYFEAVEFVKHSQDGTAAARLMEQHNLYIEHVPTPLLSSAEIWNYLLTNMTLTETLDHLITLARHGFLTVAKAGDPVVEVTKVIQSKVLEKVKDKDAIEHEKISPFTIYITIRNFTKLFSEDKDKKWHRKSKKIKLTHDKSTQADCLPELSLGARASGSNPGSADSSKRKKKKKKTKAEEQPNAVYTAVAAKEKNDVTEKNPALHAALHDAFKVAVEKNFPVTNKRYLIACKASINTIGKGIRGIPTITPLEVMALFAAFLKKKEKHREIGLFTASFTPMKFHSDVQDLIQEIGNAVAPVPDIVCDPAAPVSWALMRKKRYDVFLVLSDGNETKMDDTPSDVLALYRQKMNLPNTKMVICGLTSPKMDFAQLPGMLDIGGFDATVPMIISQFVTDKLDR